MNAEVALASKRGIEQEDTSTSDHGGGVWGFCFPDEWQHPGSSQIAKFPRTPDASNGKRCIEWDTSVDGQPQARRRLNGKQPLRQPSAIASDVESGCVSVHINEAKRSRGSSEQAPSAKVRKPG